MTINEAVNCRFVAKSELSKPNLSESSLWIRLRLNYSKTMPLAMAINVRPHFLKGIELYQKSIDGWQAKISGSQIPYQKDVHAIIGGYAFHLRPSDSGEETVYLKLHVSGLHLILIDIAEIDQKNSVELRSQLMDLGAHIGALVLIIAFGIFSYLIYPSSIMFRFCWLMFDVLACILSGSGIFAKYIFEDQPWWDGIIFNWLVCMRLALWVWISRAFLQTYTANWYLFCCKVIYALVAIAMLITLTGNIGLLQQTLLVGLIATSIAQVIAAFQSADNNKIYRNALIIGFASVNILTLLTVILAAYPVEIARAPIYLGRAVDLIAPLILLIIVAIRGRLIRDELDQVKSANMKMSLRLDFEKNLFKERQILFDMLTHELKNPLASISLAVSSLKKYFSETQAHEQRRLQNVEESVKSMDTIIERCSLMNQIDQKEITPRIEPVQLTTVLRFVIDGRMDSTRVSQSIDCNITVLADEYFFKIIISNLLDNALKYAPKDSLIEIKAGVMPALDGLEQAKLIITNKVGVLGSPDPQKIFKRFYRNPLAQSVSGSGLGLNLVRELSQIQNLKLTVDSNQERVSITLLLPLARLS